MNFPKTFVNNTTLKKTDLHLINILLNINIGDTMIIPCMIPPQEDEIMFSWINRIRINNYAPSYNSFNALYINPYKYQEQKHPNWLEYDFTENLYRFKKCSRLSDKEFIRIFFSNSLFSVYSLFMNRLQVELYLALALCPIDDDEIMILKDTLNSVTTELKYCPCCMEEQKNKYGYFWYVKSHQMPGVSVCIKHNVPLMKYTGSKRNEFKEPIQGKQYKTNIFPQDVEYTQFVTQLMLSNLQMDFSDLKELMIKVCKKKGYDKRNYNELDKVMSKRNISHLFTTKPSYFMNRQDTEGTYFDPINGFPMLYLIFKSVKEFVANIYDFNVEIKNNINNSIDVIKIKKTIRDFTNVYNKNQSFYYSGANAYTIYFKKDMYDLVGNEYKLRDIYTNRKDKVNITHCVCERSQLMKPQAFLDGARCKYCNKIMTKKAFQNNVRQISNDRYVILGQATENLFIIHDNLSHRDLTLTKNKILQELMRKTPSRVLPLDVYDNSMHLDYGTKTEKLFNWLKNVYKEEKFIFLEDIHLEWLEKSIGLKQL